jgi:TPR repeat protein
MIGVGLYRVRVMELAVSRLSLLAIGLVLLAFTSTSTSASISDCLGAYRGFAKDQKSLGDVTRSCVHSARKGAKISLSLLGTAHYEADDRAGAEPWLLRAAYQGDITAAFLLADVYRDRGQRNLAAIWAHRAQNRVDAIRKVTGSKSSAYLDSVERNIRRLIKGGVSDLVANGRQMAAESVNGKNPFLGKWKIGPNENCRNYYTEIEADGADAYFAGRRSSYQSVRFDLPSKKIILTDSAGELTMRLVDHDTMEVIRVMEHITRKISNSGVIATRC